MNLLPQYIRNSINKSVHALVNSSVKPHLGRIYEVVVPDKNVYISSSSKIRFEFHFE